MSTSTLTRTPVADRPGRAAPTRRPAPMSRLTRVELRKMFDTRAGFWLMAAILGAAVLASGALVAFAPDASITYASFTQAIGFPMAIILPIVAILAVTGEYSQRSVLTTFTLEPRRGRVVVAKALAVTIAGVAAVVVTLGVGALGNVVGSAVNGTDAVWNVSADQAWAIALGTLVAMAMGFAVGSLLRSTAAAVAVYFVYSLVVPLAAEMLAAYQQWFADLRPWIDFNLNANGLFELVRPDDFWAQLATSGLLWLVLPLAYGVSRIVRAEVK